MGHITNKNNLHKITLGCRVLGVIFVALTCQNYQKVNNQIQKVYDVLRTNAIFKHDSFEPGLVVVSFAVWIVGWYVVDLYFNSCKKWRLQESDSMEAYLKKKQGVFIELSVVAYLAPIVAYDQFYPRRQLPETAPTALQLVMEVLGCLLVYDFLFFWLHILYHKVPLFYKHVHAKHHANLVQRGVETVRLAVTEIILDVACSIIAVNITGAHPLSRAIYNAYLVYYLTELHSGYDMPWMLANVVPFGLWGGAKYHDYHHRIPNKYYQKVFTYLDKLCGFLP